VKKLTESQLSLKEDDDYLVLNGRHLLRRVLNEARTELERIHLEAQTRGEVIRVTADPEALAALLLSAAVLELTPVLKPATKKKELAGVSNKDN
jgi:hypothetical protein